MHSEMEWLADLADGVWTIFAALVGDPQLPPRVVRHRTLTAAGVGGGHVEWLGFSPYRRWPLRLCVGNPRKRLDELAAPDEPTPASPMGATA